jgi:hypothetical protein
MKYCLGQYDDADRNRNAVIRGERTNSSDWAPRCSTMRFSTPLDSKSLQVPLSDSFQRGAVVG